MDKAENKKRNQAFGQFARGLRENSNLSQAQVAEALGASYRSYVSRLESGANIWQLWHVQKLADLLGLKSSELLRQFEAEVWLYARLDELKITYRKQEVIHCRKQYFILDASTDDWIIEISGYLSRDNPFGKGDEPKAKFLSKVEIIRECDGRDLLVLNWESEKIEEKLNEFLEKQPLPF